MAYQFNGFRATKPVIRLIDASQKIYEVFFIVYDSENKKRSFRYKAGINSEPRYKRKKQAAATANVLWEALNDNWNPLIDRYPDFRRKKPEAIPINFTDALEKALQIKKSTLSKFSCYDYVGSVRFIKKAASALGISFSFIKELKRLDIREIINKAKELNKWSVKSRNKHLTILKSLLSVLVDEDMLDFNPAAKIKNDPEEETIGYKRLTNDEKERIADHLLLQAPDFFEYLMFIYDDGIRRKETLLLRIRDFNLATKEINIRPEVAKMKRGRIVPITETLLQILLRRQIWNYPPDYFLFSNNKFLPGPVVYHPNTPTTWWKKMVIQGLNIDCKMYSLKHKGADDKIMAGIDLDVLRTLYGHRSKQMTEIYARAVKGKYNQQIIDKAPVFSKLVEMKMAK